MKLFFIITALYTISTICYTTQSRYDYIQILHTGVSQKTLKQSFITKKAITIGVIDEQFSKMGYKVDRLNQKQKTDLWNALFSNISTDSKTFNAIIYFVTHNQAFFIKEKNKSRTGYSIIIDKAVYKIAYKAQGSFFTVLTKYLKDEKCDEVIIEDLKFYIGIWS